MKPVPVKADQVHLWRDRLEWHFASFCRDGSLKPDTLWADVEEKRRQLWVGMHEGAVKVALLTTVIADELQTLAVTHAAGSDRAVWLPFLGYLEAFGREIGCGRLQITCRPGYERELSRMGARKTHIMMEKAL